MTDMAPRTGGRYGISWSDLLKGAPVAGLTHNIEAADTRESIS